MAQSKLEQAKRRQRRSSSFISTDLEQWNKSDTVEVINLVSGSPQQSPMTIVTSSSPKDLMTQKSLGGKSVDTIVQKLHVNQDAPARVPKNPICSIQPTFESSAITIPDSPPIATIIIESNEDHRPKPEDPLLEGQHIPQAETQKESTRIDENAPNISIEHTFLYGERNCQKQNTSQDSPKSTYYSTAPLEISQRITKEQSHISSLGAKDIEQLNNIFDENAGRGKC